MRNIIATTVAWLVLKQALACSDNAADNYSPGTGRICAYPPVFYCSNPSADNYQAQLASSSAVAAPWTCTFSAHGCADPGADNYHSAIATGGGVAVACQYGGCNDTAATNFVPRATYNDGSCSYVKRGCMDPSSPVFSSAFTETCAWASPP